jgi:hypothetical protein
VVDCPGTYTDLAPEMPRIIILDAAEIVKEFISKINDLENLGIVVEAAIADVLMVISRQHEADANINDRHAQFILEQSNGFPYPEITSYSSAWTRFAHSLFRYIETIGLYKNNYLCYQLFQVNQNCLILEKIQFPELNDELFRTIGLVGRRTNTAYPRPSRRISFAVGQNPSRF